MKQVESLFRRSTVTAVTVWLLPNAPLIRKAGIGSIQKMFGKTGAEVKLADRSIGRILAGATLWAGVGKRLLRDEAAPYFLG